MGRPRYLRCAPGSDRRADIAQGPEKGQSRRFERISTTSALPYEQTSSSSVGTSQRCHNRTHAPQQRRLSFESHWHYDDFGEHTYRVFRADRSCGQSVWTPRHPYVSGSDMKEGPRIPAPGAGSKERAYSGIVL